ncbi:hypothetical protein AYM40_26790 [Paraburkholderia phytofirmans OLGA172]|uniref:Uncharacterized protein n=1 Tax=Paraburkholderia phytofirmans OLGA172 TaxID=1417228 RepID=A0A160FT07_9BURK|nr:hypothetical protein [Paraburkholderia phytofirmans]ANB75906.1 hypothetical protein AYM40_26790 [Paraburkholderia phytofirmans OLGA172]
MRKSGLLCVFPLAGAALLSHIGKGEGDTEATTRHRSVYDRQVAPLAVASDEADIEAGDAPAGSG